MTDIDLGTYGFELCTAVDDQGTLRVCDPRSWVLWMFSVWHGVPIRTSQRGVEIWIVQSTYPDYSWTHYTVKHPALWQAA